MSDDTWKTLRVPPDAYERAQEQRKAAGRTWGEQIVRPDGVDTTVDTTNGAVDTTVVTIDAETAAAIEAAAERITEAHEDVQDLGVLIDRLPERTAERVRAELESLMR